MKALRTILIVSLHVVFIVLLTALTQVGGLIYLGSLLFFRWRRINGFGMRVLLFCGIYLVATQVLVPPLATLNNRVPMPVLKTNKLHVKPHTVWTVLGNRHYVRPEMKAMILEAAGEMQVKFPGVTVEYLDGSFPFFASFRMLPHLQHDNGTKLDLSLIYKNPAGRYSSRYFSLFGYGFSAKPNTDEVDMGKICEEKGYRQYNLMERMVPDQEGRGLELALEENAALLKRLANNPSTFFIFLEPHLKLRLGLMKYAAIRYHGCWAVRHDDHIHVQIKK